MSSFKESRMTQGKKRKRLVLAGIVGAAVLTGSQPAMAGNNKGNDIGAGFLHTMQCIGLLITDPEKHLVECGVSDYEPGPLYVDYPPVSRNETEEDDNDGGAA